MSAPNRRANDGDCRWLRYSLAVIAGLTVLALGTAPSQAHTLRGPHATLKQREHLYVRRIAHDRGAIAAIDAAAERSGSWLYLPQRLWVKREQHERDLLISSHALGVVRERLYSPAAIICRVFGSHCREAVAVANCESHLNVNAKNGQFLGVFQMGTYARSRYGHGPDVLTQALAAYRYFLDSGWSPWECARIVGII